MALASLSERTRPSGRDRRGNGADHHLGDGELHLEIIVDRLLREFRVEANMGKPQVAYRETVKVSVPAEGRFIRQTGGRGQCGHVKIQLEPLPGKGSSF